MEKYTFGGTAFGLASIDPTTAQDQKKADAGVSGYKGFNQRVGSSGREYVPAYSVASRTLPAGTIVKIVDKRTGEPVGKQFGNTEGIYRVDGTGGPQTKNNIDFFSGNNKQMYDYYASLGTNSNNLVVTPLNIQMNSEKERQLLANLKKTPQGATADTNAEPAASDEQQDQEEDGGFLAYLKSLATPLITDFSKETAQKALRDVLGTTFGAIGKM